MLIYYHLSQSKRKQSPKYIKKIKILTNNSLKMKILLIVFQLALLLERASPVGKINTYM